MSLASDAFSLYCRSSVQQEIIKLHATEFNLRNRQRAGKLYSHSIYSSAKSQLRTAQNYRELAMTNNRAAVAQGDQVVEG
jgi:hypothetical protein